MSDPEPLVVRSVTVSEVMEPDGQVHLLVTHEGDPSLWDQLGMLDAAAVSVRMDLRDVFYDASDE